MCVGISGKVVKMKGDVALVDAQGARKEISAGLIGDLEPGDYVMIHAGIAIAKITDDDADETDKLVKELL